MYSLSTSWNSERHRYGFDVVNEIKALGFDSIELGWSLTETMVRDILSMKESGVIKISSLHNICPIPKGVDQTRASPDYYSLASDDDAERALAVAAAKSTIDYAKRFGARVVVLHTGRVKMRERMRELDSAFSDKEKFVRLREEMIRQREELKDGYLDNVIRCLGELVPYADRSGVALSIENRFYYGEIPLIPEFAVIFEVFKRGKLYYWHDAGHAEVFNRLGLASHTEFLDKFSNRLIGIHLHDIIGIMADHNPPGLGDFDFTILKPYINGDTIKVIEAHEPANAEQIRQSVDYLNRVLG
ncbi:MAG: sugar phosphate isomerase/epimerase [Candidatus Omnitrophota bacterium]|nr:sugar phosphate isomerase/epimerase [Candidatus Omnitrophota bacterium]